MPRISKPSIGPTMDDLQLIKQYHERLIMENVLLNKKKTQKLSSEPHIQLSCPTCIHLNQFLVSMNSFEITQIYDEHELAGIIALLQICSSTCTMLNFLSMTNLNRMSPISFKDSPVAVHQTWSAV